MNKIQIFTYKEKEISVLYDKKNLAYTFEQDGKTYGYKMELQSKKLTDIISVTWLLLQNAIESIEALAHDTNTTSERDTKD